MTDSLKVRLDTGFAAASGQIGAEQERFASQIAFGEWLCTRHPAKAKAWRARLAEATAMVETALVADPAAVLRAVRAAEAHLAPLAAAAKRYEVYLIGHAHIDMNWMWSWPETVSLTIDTLTTTLALLKEFPDFVFSQSQASVYRILEEHRPDLLAEVAGLVRAGRWEVTASHWVETEKNIVSAESLCQHLLLTRAYMRQLFGLAPGDVPIDWSPDTFGHAATVPTYLARGGVHYIYMHRPGAHCPPQPKPIAFRWRGPDGAEVVVFNDMACGYNGTITPGLVPGSLQRFADASGLTYAPFVFGVGDHGGGPTRRDLLRAAEMDAWPVFPRLRHATARAFFDRLAGDRQALPVITGELNSEFTGCYTTQTLIKKANRFAEKRLEDVGAVMGLLAAPLGRDVPQARLTAAWRDTLFGHFHDILPGSGVHDTRTHMHGLYQQTVATTSSIETAMLRDLAARVDTAAARREIPCDLPAARAPMAQGAGIGCGSVDGAFSQYSPATGYHHRPLIVFNTLPYARSEVVETRVWDAGWGWGNADPANLPWSVEAADGTVVPAQTLESGDFWGHRFVRLAFPVAVGACGWTRVIVKMAAADSGAPAASAAARHIGQGHHCFYAAYERSPEGLENEFIRFELDPATGGIRSLVDKTRGVELVAADAAAGFLRYAVEHVRGMTAWCVDHTGPWRAPVVKQIRRTAKGPWKAGLEVDLVIEQSEFKLVWEIRAGDPTLHIGVNGVWFQRGTPQTGVPVLAASVPFALAAPTTRYEIPFGAITRDFPYGVEVPALRWALVEGRAGKAGRTPAGCLLLNDSKHGHAFADGRLSLTLIRASHDPDILPEIGRHEIRLALRPCAGDLPTADAVQAGRLFNHELKIVATDAHDGDWPTTASLLRLDAAGVVLDTVRPAADGKGLIVRLHETAGKAARGRLHVDAVRLGRLAAATAVDLLERDEPDATVQVARDGAAVAFRMPSRAILSLRLTLAGSSRLRVAPVSPCG